MMGGDEMRIKVKIRKKLEGSLGRHVLDGNTAPILIQDATRAAVVAHPAAATLIQV